MTYTEAELFIRGLMAEQKLKHKAFFCRNGEVIGITIAEINTAAHTYLANQALIITKPHHEIVI